MLHIYQELRTLITKLSGKQNCEQNSELIHGFGMLNNAMEALVDQELSSGARFEASLDDTAKRLTGQGLRYGNPPLIGFPDPM
jgi:hypothetical protein